MNCTTLGIDLAKTLFQLHGVDERGHVVVHKRVNRKKLLETVAIANKNARIAWALLTSDAEYRKAA